MNWETFNFEIEKLAKKIDYKPDAIVGIVRGGIIPARILSTRLKVNDVYCVNVSKVGDERKIKTAILDDLIDKNLLLVEDVLESALSIIAAKEHLENRKAIVKTAALYITSGSLFIPDFYIDRIKFPLEFQFPWEY